MKTGVMAAKKIIVKYYILKLTNITVILTCNTILQYYCFYWIFDKLFYITLFKKSYLPQNVQQ